MVWLGALTGCRWSEAAGLRVGDRNLLSRTMQITQVVVKDKQGRPCVCPPKSRASERAVALPDALVQMLAEHLANASLTGADHDALIFTAPDGGLLRPDNWRRRVWMPTLEVAGLAKASPRPGFHDLRRAVATTLVGAGVNPKTVQARLGHADVRTTLEIYTRTQAEADRGAADLLARRFLRPDSDPLAPVAGARPLRRRPGAEKGEALIRRNTRSAPSAILFLPPGV